jgi:hypothetical protein
MNVVFHAADDDRLAIVVRQNAAKIAMQFFTNGRVAKKGTPFFG